MSGIMQMVLARNPMSVAVADVFSTYLYTGNGSTQTITNGINLAGKGGMVWIKSRSDTSSNYLYDTIRGAGYQLISSSTAASVSDGGAGLTSISTTGFSLGASGNHNSASNIYASWSFRKAPKFFDEVTWTGNNAASRTLNHNLGVAPGMIIVKQTNGTGGWYVYHRSSDASPQNYQLFLNLTDAAASTNTWNYTAPTSTQFTVENALNGTGTEWVAYLFAHDTATDGIIQCGSFTTDGSGNATVDLGWEPQFVLTKISSTADNWKMFDAMRGFPVADSSKILYPNLSNAEGGTNQHFVTSTGFIASGAAASQTIIYLAIRRSNKPPTTGTQVFMPVTYTGNTTPADNRLIDTTIAPDFIMARLRTDSVLTGMVTGSRITGNAFMLTGATTAEETDANSLDQQLVGATEYGTAFSSMNGVYVGSDAIRKLNNNGASQMMLAFKRAVGVFEEVCYTGTGSATTVAHGLGAVPEMIICKLRGSASGSPHWAVYHKDLGATYWVGLNRADAATTDADFWNNTAPTSSLFSVGTNIGQSSATYIARLFATKAGISKVFSVTKSSGSDATVDCGFAAGARFVLLKRTDSTGDWYVWDSTRGIVAGNDPYLLLNSTAAENTSTDYIDPINAGFTIVNGGIADGSYIGLAFA